MADIRTIIAELRELNNGPTPFATWPTDDINAVLDYIARLEAVADAARGVFTNIRSVSDGYICDDTSVENLAIELKKADA